LDQNTKESPDNEVRNAQMQAPVHLAAGKATMDSEP